MNGREQSLAQRREELVARSAAQRAAISARIEPVVRKAAALDRIVSKVREYPVVTALGVGAVALLGARRIFEIATKVMTLYALFKR